MQRSARATLPPHRGQWLASERALGRAIADHPDDPALPASLGLVLADVGRWRDAAALLDPAARADQPSPAALYLRTHSLWNAGRLDEADRAGDEMFGLYPRHVGVWFTRLYFLLYTGRGAQALAMLDARQLWPPGIPDGDFALVRAGAQAVVSHAPTDIETAMRMNLDAAHRGAGYAVNTLESGGGARPDRRRLSRRRGAVFRARLRDRAAVLFRAAGELCGTGRPDHQPAIHRADRADARRPAVSAGSSRRCSWSATGAKAGDRPITAAVEPRRRDRYT